MRKIIFCLALISAINIVGAQELKSLDKFKASFTMDSAESLGGVNIN